MWANTVLTESSLELSHGGLILRTLSSHWTHKMSSQCELAVSCLWACNSNSELTATTAWWAHRDDLMNSLQQAHGVSCKLTESSQQAHNVSHLVGSQWGITECPQNEHTTSFNVSSQWVSCEIKFFTGLGYYITYMCITIVNFLF